MKKIILTLDANGNVVTDSGYMIGCFPAGEMPVDVEESNTKSTVELVKLGVSPDEIIKLKNNDLL